MWNANCGASFEWVGRAISPYLGFLTGWLMIAAYIIGAVAGVEVIGPTVLAVFTSSSGSTWADIGIATGVAAAMLVIAVVGIRDHRADPGRHGGGRIHDPDRLRRRGPGQRCCTTITAPSRSPAGWFSLQRNRRARQHSGRAAHRRVHLQRLGRHPVRQRGSQAPPHQPGPGRHPRRHPAHRHLRHNGHGPARSGVTGQAAGPLDVRAHLHGPGHRRGRPGPR